MLTRVATKGAGRQRERVRCRPFHFLGKDVTVLGAWQGFSLSSAQKAACLRRGLSQGEGDDDRGWSNPLDRPHEEQRSGSPRPEDAALELGLRGLGPKRGRTALGRARDEATVAGKGHHGECRPDWPREYLHAPATHDLALVGRSARRHRPHLGDRERVPEAIAELDPVHQDDIVYQRGDLLVTIPARPDYTAQTLGPWLTVEMWTRCDCRQDMRDRTPLRRAARPRRFTSV